MTKKKEINPHARAYDPRETAQILSLGVTTTYALIKERKLRASKLGRRTLITTEEIDRFLREETVAI